MFSPTGPDGFPARLYDKRHGKVDPPTAQHWREHYDLINIMRVSVDHSSGRLGGERRIVCLGSGSV